MSKKKEATFEEEKIQIRSPADFFHDNKAIAGFDNSMRVVFTSIRELVENGLDAAEKANKKPDLKITIKKLTKDKIAELLGVKEFSKAGRVDFLQLTVSDNGIGVPSGDVPTLFGTVLAGSNYGARQTRGRFGLGAKMVLLNAMSSVDLPISVKSRYMLEDFTSDHKLLIDLQKNEPIVVSQMTMNDPNMGALSDSGTEVTVTFTGAWNLAKKYVKEYFHQLSVITPYASIDVKLPDDEIISLPRVVEEMPNPPQLTRIHPWGCDITQFKRELAVTKDKDMVSFLLSHFVGIKTIKNAENFLEYVKIDLAQNPKELKNSEIRRIVHEGFQPSIVDKKSKSKGKAEKLPYVFYKPKGDCLSPLGESRLKKGLEKELENPDFIEAVTREASAYLGHPFVIEAALAYGGKISMEERGKSITLFRFANRIPLLFGQGSDVSYKVINDTKAINWSQYKVSQLILPRLTVAVSLVSTKIPFPETSKEYVADVEEIRKEISLAMRQLAKKLQTHLGRTERKKRENQRRSRFEKSAPEVIESLVSIIKTADSDMTISANFNKKRLIKGLGSAEPKLIQRITPPSKPLYETSAWLSEDIKRALSDANINYIADFMIKPKEELSKINGLDIITVEDIKKQTLFNLNNDPQIAKVESLKLFSPRIEKVFKIDTRKLMAKRWINTVYDFFANPTEELLKIENFAEIVLSQLQRKELWLLSHNNELMEISAPENVYFTKATIIEVNEELVKEFKDLRSTLIQNDRKFTLKNFASSSWLLAMYYFISLQPSEAIKFNTLMKKLIEESKDKINNDFKEKLDNKISAASYTWITGDLRQELQSAKIITWNDYNKLATVELMKFKKLKENLAKECHQEVVKYLMENGPKLSIEELSWYNHNNSTVFSNVADLTTFLGLKNISNKENENFCFEMIKNFREEKVSEFNELLGNNIDVVKMIWIPEKVRQNLQIKNIKNLFNFLCLDNKNLNDIIKPNDYILLNNNVVEEIKISNGYPLYFLSETDRSVLEEENISILEELLYLQLEKIPKKIKDLIIQLREKLDNKICFYPDLPPKILKRLYYLGIYNIGRFLIWPTNEIAYSTLGEDKIFILKQKLSLDRVEEIKSTNSIQLEDFKHLFDKKLFNLLIENEITTIEDFYFSIIEEILLKLKVQPKDNEKITKMIIDSKNIFEKPVVLIKDFPIEVAFKLKECDISQIIEFMFIESDYLARETDLSKEEIEILKKNIKEDLKPGNPLKEYNLFSKEIVNNFAKDGITTIEQIYFSLEQESFVTEKLSWADFQKTIRLLEIPVSMAIMEFKKEVKDEEGNSKEISTEKPIAKDISQGLASMNINSVIELLVCDLGEVSAKIKVPVKKLTEIKSHLKIREHDISLFDLGEFDKKTEKKLDTLGITTIQDLYFLDITELEEADYPTQQFLMSLKSTLDVPLSVFTFFTKESLAKLSKQQISNVMRFLLISQSEIARIAGITEKQAKDISIEIDLLQIIEKLNKPLAILTAITPDQQRILSSKGIMSVLSFISTPVSQLQLHLGIEREEILNIIGSVKLEELESSSELLIPITKFFKLTKREEKSLKDLNALSVDVITYSVTESTFKDNLALWNRVKEIKEILDIPFPMIYGEFLSNNQVKILNDNDIKTTGQFIMWPSDSLVELLKISIKDVEKIKNQDLDQINRSLSLDIFLIDELTNEQTSNLISKNITNIRHLLNSTPEQLMDILSMNRKDVIKLFNEFNIKKLERSLNFPLSFSLDLTKDELLSLARRKIKSTYDFLIAPIDELATALNRNEEEILEFQNKIEFEELKEILNYEIIYLPEITGYQSYQLLKNEVKTISDFLNLSDEEILSKVTLSKAKLKKVKDNLSLSSIKDKKSNQGHNVDVLSTFNVDEETSSSIKGNITHEELFYGKMSNLKSKGITKDSLIRIRDIYQLPIEFLKLPDHIIAKFKKINLSSIIEYFTTNNEDLQVLIGDKFKLPKKESINLKAIEDSRKSSISLIEIKGLTKSIADKLQNNEIVYIHDYLITEKEKIEEILTKEEVHIVENLEAALPFITLLSGKQLVQFAKIGYGSVASFLTIDVDNIPNSLITQEEFNEIKTKLSLSTIRKSVFEQGTKLSLLNAFTDSVRAKFEKAGVKNLEEVYFMMTKDSSPPGTWSSIESFRFAMDASIHHHEYLKRRPSMLLSLAKEGIATLAEFLWSRSTYLMEILDLDEDTVLKIKYSFDLKVVKRKRKIGISLENVAKLNTRTIAILDELGIYTVKDLYFKASKINYSKHQGIDEEFIKNLIKNLNSPAILLYDMPLGAGKKLKDNGINSTIHFLLTEDTELSKNINLKINDIRSAKKKIEFYTKQELKERISQAFG